MRIRYKKNGNFEVEFNEYFKNISELKKFISENNKFINVEVLGKKIETIYDDLTLLDYTIKSSSLNWFIIGRFNFKYKRPNNFNFWLERGYGINEFNKSVSDNIVELSFNAENSFKFNKFKFKYVGIPKCNLCGSDLHIEPSIGRYNIIGCKNKNCETYNHENISSIKQLAFLPIELYINKNKRININSKVHKEYWLLKGVSYDEAILKINEIKEKLQMVNINSFDYYKITTDMNDEEITSLINGYSPLSTNFWVNKGLTIAEANKKIRELQIENSNKLLKLRKENPENYTATTQTQIGYWINKGYSKEKAKEILSKRQRTFSKEICIQKYGEEKGLKIFNERQKKWLENNKRSNFSKISQELFWDILNENPKIKEDEVYFATYNKGALDNSGKNHEYRLNVIGSYILPDFFIKNKNKIIEFDGTYYHRKTPENAKREANRDKMIIESGYKILHISEYDYKNKKDAVIKKCLDFLCN